MSAGAENRPRKIDSKYARRDAGRVHCNERGKKKNDDGKRTGHAGINAAVRPSLRSKQNDSDMCPVPSPHIPTPVKEVKRENGT